MGSGVIKDIDKQNIDRLITQWDGFNPETVYSVMDAPTPLVSIAMLSYRRRNRLIEVLKRLPTHNTPLNMCLRVQESPEDPEVIELLEKFYDYDVMFSDVNLGTAVPRQERSRTALKFNTPFIMFTDDDIKMPPYSIELLTSILIDNPEYGAVNMFTAPNSNVWREIGEGQINDQKPIGVFDCDRIASLGAATLVVRREVFETCDVDTDMKIGLVDVDFGLQVFKSGWKMGMLNINGYHAVNQKGGDAEYHKARDNREWINASVKHFKTKWSEYS